MAELTIDNIISLLKRDGINSKHLVVDLLENANIKDLYTLKRDIEVKINEKVMKGEEYGKL